MKTDRSDRVIPLATRVIELLATEEDSEVRISAFDVAKVAMDHQKMLQKKRPIAEMTRKVIAALETRIESTEKGTQ